MAGPLALSTIAAAALPVDAIVAVRECFTCCSVHAMKWEETKDKKMQKAKKCDSRMLQRLV